MAAKGMDANGLRRAFIGFFTARGHEAVPSAPLVPVDPTVLFTIAGMVPFKPYYLGDQPPPYRRATSVQKCFRMVDIENVGTTFRHFTFFEMLGNFSFGDYFKEQAIPMAWELLTGTLGMDEGRLWVSVHESDREATDIWADTVGFPRPRIQKMGEENWWGMGEVGPCGPSSEVYFDRGNEYGAGGGPAAGDEERYVEIWNLVFMQHNRLADGTLADLPRKNIDTGAGLDRVLPLIQGVESAYDTDLLAPVVDAACSVTGRGYGDRADVDVSLRIMADHARAVTFLVSDGVFPSNEGRGYVLRRVIRRAVRRAFQLGVENVVMPELSSVVVSIMKEAYPELARNEDAIASVLEREEERFRQTLKVGSAILDEELEGRPERVTGEVAFRLHDTFGFPIELTGEIAAERGVEVDLAGFEAAMDAQRRRAREASKGVDGEAASLDVYRALLEELGPTVFTGYDEYTSGARVIAVLPAGRDAGTPARSAEVELFLDRTPFYAEGGGQVGDTGAIVTPTGRAIVSDTTYALPGLVRHHAVVEGEVMPGQDATARVDAVRRDAIRRNHTGTHLLHWALREALGDHVKQQGSLVAPDRLRFDFSHFAAVGPEELRRVEDMVNEKILADEPVHAYETSRADADRKGAVAFFGEKYGEAVRVVEAGSDSVELCGGTHVNALGMIGPIKIVSEGSIGSNTRRIEALTGLGSLERIRETESTLNRTAGLLRSQSPEVPDAVERLLDKQQEAEAEVRALRASLARAEAEEMAAEASDGVVVARRDGLDQAQLRELAASLRDKAGIRAAVLIGSPDGRAVALVAAVAKGAGLRASDLIADAARTVGGGGGRDAELAVAGGRDPGRIEEALGQVRARLGAA